MRRILKWLLSGMAVVVVIMTLLVLAGIVVLNTESGSQWTVRLLADRVPGEVRIEATEGTLWSGLRIPVLVFQDDTRRVRASNIELGIDWAAAISGRLVLRMLDIDSVHHLDLRDTPPTAFTVDLQPPGIPVGIGRSRIGLLEMTGNGKSTRFREIRLLDVFLDGDRLRLESLSAAAPGFTFNATAVRTSLKNNVPLRSEIDWSTIDNAWSGHGKVSGSLTSLAFEQKLSGPYPFAANGTISLLGRTEPEIDAALQWDRWSVDDVHFDAGAMQLRGTINDYTAEFETVAELAGDLYVQVTGSARGTTSSLPHFDVRFNSRAGSAEATGEFAWSPALTGAADINLHDFDPSIAAPELSGRLDAFASVVMTGTDDFIITLSSATGVLNNTGIAAKGTLGWQPSGTRCEQCELSIGANRLSVDGTMQAEGMVVDVSLKAPALAELWPGIDGSLQATGRIEGTRTEPRFTGDVHGQRLRYADWLVGSLTAESRSSGIDGVDFSLRATGLQAGEIGFGELDAQARGSMEQLGIEANWSHNDLGAWAVAKLGFDGREITGIVERAGIHEPNTGGWTLTGPFGLRAAAGEFEADSHQWSGPGGKLNITRCSSADTRFELVAMLEGLPLQTASPFLPAGYHLRGTASADIDVTREGQSWTGFVDWRQAGTHLSVLPASGERVDIQVPRALAHAGFSNGGADISAALTIEPGVIAELDMRLERLSADSGMTAELRLSGDEWDWVPAVIPVIDNFEGSLSARISASGDLPSPELSGSATWRDGRLFIPALNAPMENIALEMNGAPDGAATITGSLSAGEGSLEIAGRMEELLNANRSVELSLTGQDAALLNWPEYQLWATPDLVIRGDANGWTLSGTMQVPRAAVTVRELSSGAIRPSPDVIVHGDKVSPTAPMPYSGDIGLTFGDNVHVKAFGLETRITGNLQMRIPDTGQPGANGQLNLVEGKFEAFGQKLSIEQGTLTFSGPLDNPLVDVRAQRVIEAFEGTVTAGIHLRGRAQNLTSSIYSEPAMSEADALSYLAFGRPLNQATETEGNQLAGAAIALGVGQASRITGQIGRKLGLDQLSVAGDGDDAIALIAGKQINNRLYARYAYGAFTRIGTLLLRYRMSKRLMLEAGAGETQTIDVLYTVEKK